ncbi:MAG TPA: hypothetical protein VL652_04540 [Kutzneria sp.]|jgi:hypothetical protein|nr:hypothetical protein [Kutzneria sp.]
MTGDELHELELDVQAEIDPTTAAADLYGDAQRYQVGLRTLLGAVEAVEEETDRS